jgi:HEPN domain-containing protein
MNEQIEDFHNWIEKADHDLGTAKIIFLHIPEYYDIIAFHCQQAVEKYIKALLIHYRIEFIRSHDLVYLLDLLTEKIKIDDIKFKSVFSLNNYSVQIRYPNKIIHLSKDELVNAIKTAEDFRIFCLKEIMK